MTNWSETVARNVERIRNLAEELDHETETVPHDDLPGAMEIYVRGEGASSRCVIVAGTDSHGSSPGLALYDGMGGGYAANANDLDIDRAVEWLIGSTTAWSAPRTDLRA